VSYESNNKRIEGHLGEVWNNSCHEGWITAIPKVNTLKTMTALTSKLLYLGAPKYSFPSLNHQIICHNLPAASHTSLRHLPRDLNLKRSKLRHNTPLLLLHALPAFHSLRQHPQIIHIIRRRKRVKELRLLVKRVAERMNRFRRYDYVVPGFAVHDPFVGREADSAFGDEEGFVVHPVPVEDWTGRFARDGQGHTADAVVRVAAVLEDANYGLRC
jgi:hypothetical protein